MFIPNQEVRIHFEDIVTQEDKSDEVQITPPNV